MNLIEKVTVEDAMKVYTEKGICCTVQNGKIVCEVECEDYCNN